MGGGGGGHQHLKPEPEKSLSPPPPKKTQLIPWEAGGDWGSTRQAEAERPQELVLGQLINN